MTDLRKVLIAAFDVAGLMRLTVLHVNAFMMYVQAQMTGITCWPYASPTVTSSCYDRSMTCRRLRYAAT